MSADRTASWLEKRLRQEASLSLLLAALGLAAGAAILLVTWGVMYLVAMFALSWWVGYGHWLLVLLPTLMIPLLFWGHATTDREYLAEYSITTGGAGGRAVSFYLPGVGMASNVNPLAPDTLHTAVKMITDCLYFGPRVITSAWGLYQKSFRLKQVDVPACAAVIHFLALAGFRRSFQEIADAVPGLDPATTFPQLQLIDGVLFLGGEEPGVSLAGRLRGEVADATDDGG